MAKKILVIKSSSMGDIVHALPVAYDIKKHFPDSELSWVVEESFTDIPKLSPYVDKIVVTAFRRWRRHVFSSSVRSEVMDLRRTLAQAHYDIVIDLQGLIRTALVARWAGVESVGYSKDNIKEPLAARFYTRTLPVSKKLVPVVRYRTMVAQALGYSIEDESLHYGLNVTPMLPRGVTPPYAALAVNTSRAEKLWPKARWVEVVRALEADGIKSVLFWGGDKEKLYCDEIAAAVPGACTVLPRMNLKALAEVIAGAKCLLGVDTGLTHLGAALAVPSVGIIVGTSAELFSLVSEAACDTVGDKGVVPQPEEVLAAMHSVLAEAAPSHSH
mgnify:FL=1